MQNLDLHASGFELGPHRRQIGMVLKELGGLPRDSVLATKAVLTHNRYTLLDRSANTLLDRAASRGMAVLNAAPYSGGMLAKGPDRWAKYMYRDAPPELVERASSGEEIVLSRHGKPKARLVPIDTAKKAYVQGAGRGKWKGIDAILDRPLPDDVLEGFYRRATVPPEKDL